MASFESICAQEVVDPRTTKPHILPMYLTSSFEFESIDQGIRIFNKEETGHVYSRYGNPTVEAVAAKIATLESYDISAPAHAILFSSGMAALHTLILSALKSGDKILSQGNLYGGSTELILKIAARSGIETELIDLTNLDLVSDVLSRDKTIRLVYFETPANPTLACIDLKSLSDIARAEGVLTAVDNTFATPYLQRPFNFGIDIVLHSTTKYLNGHGTSIAGALVGTDIDFMQSQVWDTMKLIGTNPGIMDAWLVHQGMKTLPLRMDRHSSNALTLARHLEQDSRVAQVNYCGLESHPHHSIAKQQMKAFGGMLSFEVKGGIDAGITMIRKLRMCRLAPTLGDVDTLVMHPAAMSHRNVPREVRERNGITDGLIRISVGIEHIDDIVADIDQALMTTMS